MPAIAVGFCAHLSHGMTHSIVPAPSYDAIGPLAAPQMHACVSCTPYTSQGRHGLMDVVGRYASTR